MPSKLMLPPGAAEYNAPAPPVVASVPRSGGVYLTRTAAERLGIEATSRVAVMVDEERRTMGLVEHADGWAQRQSKRGSSRFIACKSVTRQLEIQAGSYRFGKVQVGEDLLPGFCWSEPVYPTP